MGTNALVSLSIWSRNSDADLRRPALRAKRTAILDRISALLAGMLHVFEASAQRNGEQGMRITLVAGRSSFVDRKDSSRTTND